MIYIADISKLNTADLEKQVCDERIKYSSKYRKEIDRRRSLAVEALLNHALISEGYEGSIPVSVCHMDNQRPFFPEDIIIPGYGKVYFSLSHAGDYVAVAISDKPVGIDIEEIADKENNSSIAKRFYTDGERQMIKNCPEGECEAFFRIWTLKEAFIKAVGVGLSLGIDTFGVETINNRQDISGIIVKTDLTDSDNITDEHLTGCLNGVYSYSRKYEGNAYEGYGYNVMAGYAVSVCVSV